MRNIVLSFHTPAYISVIREEVARNSHIADKHHRARSAARTKTPYMDWFLQTSPFLHIFLHYISSLLVDTPAFRMRVATICVVDDYIAPILKKRIQALDRQMPEQGLRVFFWEVIDV